ncbi:MAG: DUF6484 domain-containing protein [Pseudomonadota bacterium]|nr:DUF6484 domain-containing protein [Pseudomonadota bacterium]
MSPRRIQTDDSRIDGVVIGYLIGLDADGIRLVDYPGNPVGSPVPVIALASPGTAEAGQQVALMFEGGDPRRPILIGPIVCQDRPVGTAIGTPKAHTLDVSTDGQRVTLTAEKEIVLRCGEASITLTHAGKILIRGAYVVSRSSGVNRIKGGSVQIN